MAYLVEPVKYGAINTTDIATNGFYVIMFKSEAYTLQDNTKIDEKIITSGELVAKEQYICSMQVDTNRYWNQHPQHHVITVPTLTIIHPRLEFNAVAYFNAIPKSVYNRTLAKQSISRHPVCLTVSDCDYILEGIGRRDKIRFIRYVEVYSDDE